MKSPRAVNRKHVRYTPNSAQKGRGKAAASTAASRRAIRQTLVNLNQYAIKAAIVFNQFDLKISEHSKKPELSKEQLAEKSRKAAQKKAEKDAQLNLKKEAEQKRKQAKQAKKLADEAHKPKVDAKLEAATYVPPTVVVEESAPIKKEESKKNKKSTKKPEPAVEEVVEKKEVKVAEKAPEPEKKSKKKESKKSESDKAEVKLVEPTPTPKNTPVDTPKEQPATPAEPDLEHQEAVVEQIEEPKSKSKKGKKDKKHVEPVAEKVEAPVVEEPVVEEPVAVKAVEQQQQQPAPEVHEESFSGGNNVSYTEPVVSSSDLDLEASNPAKNPKLQENLDDAGVSTVKHWQMPTMQLNQNEYAKFSPSPEREQSPKAEAPIDIWEEFASGKPLFKDEAPVEQAPVIETTKEEAPTIDIWEEFASGKPLFKEDKPVEEEPVVQKQVVEAQQTAPAEPTIDIWEEFASGKPLFEEEEKPAEAAKAVPVMETLKQENEAQVEEAPKAEKASKNKKNKNKKGRKESESKEELVPDNKPVFEKVVVEVQENAPEEKPVDIWEEFASGKPLFKEDAPSAVFNPVEESTNGAVPSEKPVDIWEEFASGKPLFKEDEKPEETNQQQTEETATVEIPAEAPIDIWEEFASGKPLFKDDADTTTSEQKVEAAGDIWEEFASGKPLFKEDKPQEQEVVPSPEAEKPQELDYATETQQQPQASGKAKDNKKSKNKKNKKHSESHDEVKKVESEVEKPVVQAAEPVEIKIDDKENKHTESKKNKKNKKSSESQDSGITVESEAAPISPANLGHIEAEDSEVKAAPTQAAEAPVDIWEEFASGKPLFKEETKTAEAEEEVPEELLQKAEETIKASQKLWEDEEKRETSAKPETPAEHVEILDQARAQAIVAPESKTEAFYSTEDEPDQPATSVHMAESIETRLIYAGEDEPEPQPSKEASKSKKNKKHRKSESEHNNNATKSQSPTEAKPAPEELKYEEPVKVEETKPKENGGSSKNKKNKNKKGKTVSESESPVVKVEKAEPVNPEPVTVAEPVVEAPKPKEKSVTPPAAPAPTNGSSKNKKKKGKHDKETKEVPQAEVVVENGESKQNGVYNPADEGQHQIGEELVTKKLENGAHATNGTNEKVTEEGFQEPKGKKNRKKNKSRSSESHESPESNKLENAEVIHEISYEKDMDKEGTSHTEETQQPASVNNVHTSSQESNGQKITRDNITATYELDPSAVQSPTNFSLHVQKLVENALAASELKNADPSAKLSVQAKLLRLKEKSEVPLVTYQPRTLTPLAFERQRTVEHKPAGYVAPVPRERAYKLLPRDVLLCSHMIDTHGEDYEGMSKDPKNVYRDTARGLQRKLRVFKESPHFATYQKAKDTGRTVQEILDEEAAAATPVAATA
ncbi:unnamed protein product, partial [Mesorhabditis spiculigera]